MSHHDLHTNIWSFALKKRFLPFFFTQLAGALNDNLFKTALFVLISFYGIAHEHTLPLAQLLNIGSLLFISPYFFFSSIAGEIGTRYNKANLVRIYKLLEVAVMLVAAMGFWLGSLPILALSLFLMGTQSTLFGPIKYAILPEHLQENELLAGNGLIEGSTFLAILFGQFLGTILAADGIATMSFAVIFIAILGYVSSLFMSAGSPGNPNAVICKNLPKSTFTLIKRTLSDAHLSTNIIGISWFWSLGILYTTQLPSFTKVYLNGSDSVFNLLLGLFSIGIGLGSVMCAKVAHYTKNNLFLVSVGAWGMAFFGLLMVLSIPSAPDETQNFLTFVTNINNLIFSLSMIATGFSGGFFSIPLYTWLQSACSRDFRSHAIAANNIFNSLFMVIASVVASLVIALFDSVALLYTLTALTNLLILWVLSKRNASIQFKIW